MALQQNLAPQSVGKTLILMWLDELTYDEIASNMGLPRNTVASKLHRIKDLSLIHI